MTLHATKAEHGNFVEVHGTSGSVTFKVTEHPGHVRGFHSQLGRVLDEAEGQQHAPAHRAYEAYREHCGGTSVHGEALPAWEDQEEAIRAHWEAAVDAIR